MNQNPILWVKVTEIGTINVEADESRPEINSTAAGWIEQIPDQNGQPIDKPDGAIGYLNSNPLIGSKLDTKFTVGEYYYIRRRTYTYGNLFSFWEPVGSPSNGCGVVSSVQCSGSVLMVTYCS